MKMSLAIYISIFISQIIWRLATGDWRLATGDWRLVTGDWRLVTVFYYFCLLMESLREQLLILISTPIYIIIIGIELLLTNYRHKKAYTWKDTFTNVYLMLMNGLLDLLLRGFYRADTGLCLAAPPDSF